MTQTEMLPSSLIVIPCLNEAAHIGALLRQLQPAAARLGASIVVADGGSTDGTLAIVQGIAGEDPKVLLLHNEKRIQSAAINLAVAEFVIRRGRLRARRVPARVEAAQGRAT